MSNLVSQLPQAAANRLLDILSAHGVAQSEMSDEEADEGSLLITKWTLRSIASILTTGCDYSHPYLHLVVQSSSLLSMIQDATRRHNVDCLIDMLVIAQAVLAHQELQVAWRE